MTRCEVSRAEGRRSWSWHRIRRAAAAGDAPVAARRAGVPLQERTRAADLLMDVNGLAGQRRVVQAAAIGTRKTDERTRASEFG